MIRRSFLTTIGIILTTPITLAMLTPRNAQATPRYPNIDLSRVQLFLNGIRRLPEGKIEYQWDYRFKMTKAGVTLVFYGPTRAGDLLAITLPEGHTHWHQFTDHFGNEETCLTIPYQFFTTGSTK